MIGRWARLSALGVPVALLAACSAAPSQPGAQPASGSSPPAGLSSTAATTGSAATPSPADSASPSAAGTADPSTASGTAQPTDVPTSGAGGADVFSTDPQVSVSELPGQLSAVSTDSTAGVDELVFTFDSQQALPGYRVEFVPDVTRGPNGEPVEIDGNAFLSVAFTSTTAGPPGPLSPDIPTDEEFDLPLLQQIVLVYNVGGDLRFGVGLTGPAAYQVQALSGPARLVIQLRPTP